MDSDNSFANSWREEGDWTCLHQRTSFPARKIREAVNRRMQFPARDYSKDFDKDKELDRKALEEGANRVGKKYQVDSPGPQRGDPLVGRAHLNNTAKVVTISEAANNWKDDSSDPIDEWGASHGHFGSVKQDGVGWPAPLTQVGEGLGARREARGQGGPQRSHPLRGGRRTRRWPRRG